MTVCYSLLSERFGGGGGGGGGMLVGRGFGLGIGGQFAFVLSTSSN